MSSTVIQFLNDVPILATTLTLANLGAVVCCLFVFCVIQSTHLHANCRFLFTIWSLSFIVLFTSHVAVSALSFFSVHGYLPQSTVDPPVRIHVMRIGVAAIFIATSMEILIGLERAASAANPQRYHDEAAMSKRTIMPLLAMTLGAATLFACITFGTSLVLCGIIFGTLDFLAIIVLLQFFYFPCLYHQFTFALSCTEKRVFFCTLCISKPFASINQDNAYQVNTVAMKYCRKKDLESFGISSLNARYQVKESADMASAMQPALLIAFLLKSSAGIVFVAVCMGRGSDECHLHSFNWGILEAFFMINSLISGVLLNIRLIHNHPRLRRNAGKILPILSRSGYAINRMSVAIPPRNEEKDLYFNDLKRLWEL